MMAISIHSLTAKCCNVTWISCLLHFNFYLGKNSMEIYFVIYLKRHVCNPPMMIAIFGIKTDPQQQHFNHSYYNRWNQTVILHTFIFILVIASGKTSGWECFTLLSLIENVPWKDVSQNHRRGYVFILSVGEDMHSNLCFASTVQKLLATRCFKYVRVFWWQTTNNVRSASSNWLSTSQGKPLPLALWGALVGTVIWGSIGTTSIPTGTGCIKDVAEAHWQHEIWWQSCWVPLRDQPFRTVKWSAQ